MPFGLKCALIAFQKFVNEIFLDMIDSGLVIIYMDDILIVSATLEEHYNIVLRRIAEKGLELKLRHAGVTNLIHRVHPKKLSSAT